MSVLIFKLCLPLLLGYTLFTGISGRFVPFIKPAPLEQRPSWFLGLWVGASVALVTGIAMHMAMQIPIDKITTLGKPTGVLLMGLITVGFLGFLFYRNDVAAEQRYQAGLNRATDEMLASTAIDFEFDENDEPTLVSSDEADVWEFDSTIRTDRIEELGTADFIVEQSDIAAQIGQQSEASDVMVIDEIVDSGDKGSVSLLFNEVSTPIPVTEKTQQSAPARTEASAEKTQNIAPAKTEASAEKTQSIVTAQAEAVNDLSRKNDAMKTELANTKTVLTEKQVELADTQSELSEKRSANTKLGERLDQLTQELTTEAELRSQTETHLRITRKALKSLEGDAREFEIEKANAIIAVEVQLESHVKETASSQARANREEVRRVEAENKIVDLTQDLLQSKRELRQSTEARARALRTANKSVDFARKNVQARARAEARIKLLESRLKLSQQALKSRSSVRDDKRFKQEVGSRIKRKLIRHREPTDG